MFCLLVYESLLVLGHASGRFTFLKLISCFHTLTTLIIFNIFFQKQGWEGFSFYTVVKSPPDFSVALHLLLFIVTA
jgi:hypothetical protein